MKIIVACEESQEVTKAFRKLGHIAYSCDLLPSSGGHPEWHIQENVLNILNSGWDMMIAHPPCTYLTTTANRSFVNNPDRWKKRLEAMEFVWQLMNAPIEKIAIENPKGVISTHIRKPDQYIQPYHFGHPDSKMTGLWLKNLPLLKSTSIVEPEWITSPSGKRHSLTHWKTPSTNNPVNAKIRSKTYTGIAEAMAQQWGNLN
jgi:hypothetical protein